MKVGTLKLLSEIMSHLATNMPHIAPFEGSKGHGAPSDAADDSIRSLLFLDDAYVCVCVLTTGSEGLPYYAFPTTRLIRPPQCLQPHIPAGLRTPASPWGDVS